MRVNNIDELIELIETDKITPEQGIESVCKAYNLIPIVWDTTEFNKKEVINEIKALKEFAEAGNEMPIFFFAPYDDEFSFNNAINTQDNE